MEKDEVIVTEESGSVKVVIKKIGSSERSVFVNVFTEPGTAEG